MLQVLLQRCPHCMRLASRRSINSTASIIDKTSYKRVVDPPQPHDNYDQVSSPDPDSNIRRVVYSKPKGKDEELLNSQRNITNLWNDQFWKEHNKAFFREKKEFIEKSNAASGTGQEVSDKLSIFYKEFLERNHDTYMEYNSEWYRRNFNLLWMSIRTLILNPFVRKKQVPSNDVVT